MLLARLKISGHSMEPDLRFGQFVLVSSIPFFFSKPKIGDVVVFKNSKKLIIKRIVKEVNKKFLVEGDNKKDSHDFGFIEKKEILGKVIYK